MYKVYEYSNGINILYENIHFKYWKSLIMMFKSHNWRFIVLNCIDFGSEHNVDIINMFRKIIGGRYEWGLMPF